MIHSPPLLCRCGRVDFEAEQVGVYARYGLALGNYFALLDKFTWEDEFHAMAPRAERLRLEDAYPRVGNLIAGPLSEAIVRCELRTTTATRLASWASRLGLSFGDDVGPWLSYRMQTRGTFRLLPSSELDFRCADLELESYGRCAAQPSLQS